MKTLVYHSYIFCSNEKHLYLELKYLRKVFHQNNSYPHWLVNRVFHKAQDDFRKQKTVKPLPDTSVLNDVRKQTLLLPYAGQYGCTLVKSLKTHLKRTLPPNVKTDIVYTGSPPRWNSPCRGEGATRSSNQSASTRRAQLSVAAKSSDQQIFSTMSRPESTLIRQD